MERISALSDELLLKILLLVPTKVAVSTSILSKRWEYLWMWLPKLEFGDRYSSSSECKRLQCFLNRNLPLHRTPVIESFRLEIYSPCFKPENINLWLVIAVSHCVRELAIFHSSYKAKPSILPRSLYTCKSLEILTLDGGIFLDVPRMVSLPSLKTLKLQSVRYFNDETLQRLLSNCPILEDLVVDLRENDITGKLTVVAPSLQRLSLYIPSDHDIDGFVIDTPSLTYFKLTDHNSKSHDCLIEMMPNLIEAHVDVEFPDIKSLIGSLTYVKRLAICSEAMCDEGIVFNQLEHMELCTCKEHSSNQLVRLLKASSNLQGLDITVMGAHESTDIVYWNEPSTVPECLSSSLRTLNWWGYAGEPGARAVAVYILRNGAYLKTAKISYSEEEIPELEMIKELALSSRASTTCQLILDSVW